MTASGERLIRLTDLADPVPALSALEEIFFESSSRTRFASDAERQQFFRRWTSFYLTRWRSDVWLVREDDGWFSGYLTGCRDSIGARALYDDVPGYATFEARFAEFPAHLHVNCRTGRRGLGLGSTLVTAFTNDCRAAGLSGVHLVTAPEARNVGFYQRLGFTVREVRPFGDRSLLFLGRRLLAEATP